jgi:hypothetical protein
MTRNISLTRTPAPKKMLIQWSMKFCASFQVQVLDNF